MKCTSPPNASVSSTGTAGDAGPDGDSGPTDGPVDGPADGDMGAGGGSAPHPASKADPASTAATTATAFTALSVRARRPSGLERVRVQEAVQEPVLLHRLHYWVPVAESRIEVGEDLRVDAHG
ncbi:hypothetical protein ACQEVZ_43410 [Dactylosporangium sp. CA-152071]|uniref:hypothetical protein n=1 Tax=Dactylosporangium sp. CA-152071 TaxID=3239933 RepID=UPI003D928060